MNGLGTLQSLDAVKLRAGLMKQGDLDHLLLVGYIIVRGCIKLLFTYNVTKQSNRLKQLLCNSARLEQDREGQRFVVSKYLIYFIFSSYIVWYFPVFITLLIMYAQVISNDMWTCVKHASTSEPLSVPRVIVTFLCSSSSHFLRSLY